MTADPTALERRDATIVAGHRGDLDTVLAHLDDDEPTVRVAALGALHRLGELTATVLTAAFADPSPAVRRRAGELAGAYADVSLLGLLADPDPTVVEVAAWACGEQEDVDDAVLDRLIELATTADDPLGREAAAAALGAIGDERGLPAILAACDDKPHVRRRAVLALAPFDGPEVEAAIDRALADRDWQVRQAAEDLRRATGEVDLT
ncbi:MAG TPA: HEAT repeat domain-containing protein [Ilumatobacter sp.]